jgi:hypothetical protein
MLAAGLAAQVAALPSELDASYRRALPMLRGRIDEEQSRHARRILFACSLTYAAASINPLIVLLPWLGGPWRLPLPALRAGDCVEAVGLPQSLQRRRDPHATPEPARPDDQPVSRSGQRSGWVAAPRRSVPNRSQPPDPGWPGLKAFARPWIRTWLRLTGDY